MRCGIGALLVMVGAAGAAQAAVEENFLVRNTRDLVALCGAPPGSDNYVAAINFCHGYALGAYQYYQALEGVSPAHKLVCVTEPRPSRNDAVAAFVRWAEQNPQHGDAPAVDTMFRWLSETYPCQ